MRRAIFAVLVFAFLGVSGCATFPIRDVQMRELHVGDWVACAKTWCGEFQGIGIVDGIVPLRPNTYYVRYHDKRMGLSLRELCGRKDLRLKGAIIR